MSLSKADTILHPIRLRIIVTVENRPMTPQQIAAALPDVPQASLYRHINRLRAAGILTVVEEKPVRGVVEKVYAIQEDAALLQPEDLAHLTREDHQRYFTHFMALLLGQFRAYLQQETFDLAEDGVTYREAALYLSDEEYAQVRAEMGATIQRLVANAPTPERRRRLLALLAIPERRTP
jgi:DNA-binding transcriptional ArsR family regulator